MVQVIAALSQLLALVAFGGGVAWLNGQAPRRVSQRVFKLSWLLPTVAASFLFFWLISTHFINAPHRLQHTHTGLVLAHDAIRAECTGFSAIQQFDRAYSVISKRTKTAELVGEARAAAAASKSKSNVNSALGPVLNFILFHSGVTVVFFPALLRLLLLLWKIKTRGNGGDEKDRARFDEKVRREWGVFLPVMNAVTLISLCVSPTFYFFIEPGRAHRCMYTSGHWYTFTCTLLTFAFVITHLYRNREYSKSCMRLLTWYFAWLVIYLAAALMVLRTTQTFFHDSLEARDGIRQAMPAYSVFVIILCAFQYLTATKRDIVSDPVAKEVAAEDEDDQQIDEQEEEQVAAKPAPKKKASSVKKAAKAVAAPTADAEEEDEDEAEYEKVSPPASTDEDNKPRARKPAAAKAASPAASTTDDSSAIPSPPPMVPPMAPPAPAAPSAAPKVAASKPKPKPAAAPSAPNPRDEMLAAIAGGAAKRLRPSAGPNAKGGPGGALAPPAVPDNILARAMQNIRVAVDGEKDEGPEDEWSP